MAMNAPVKVSEHSYDLGAFAGSLGDVQIETDTKALQMKTRHMTDRD
jgi:hypothetical protein